MSAQMLAAASKDIEATGSPSVCILYLMGVVLCGSEHGQVH